jgi:hypothetical protein
MFWHACFFAPEADAPADIVVRAGKHRPRLQPDAGDRLIAHVTPALRQIASLGVV